MYNGQEKREYKRIEKSYAARFKIRSDEVQEMESDDWDSITLKNLSAGGTFFTYKKNLGTGTLLDLKIDVHGSMLIINYVGKVIRIDKPESTSMYSTAINLIDISKQKKEVINTAVEKALEQTNKTSVA